MYCNCGSAIEMKPRQEQQEWQAKGETIYYLHCTACGRNHIPKSEAEKKPPTNMIGG